MTDRQLVTGLAVASFIAPATVVPIMVMSANARLLSEGWWAILPASLVYIALLAVGSQLFSASVSAILRTRRGRDVATFLILGLAAGSFFTYRAIAETIADKGISQAVLDVNVVDLGLVVAPGRRATIDHRSGVGQPIGLGPLSRRGDGVARCLVVALETADELDAGQHRRRGAGRRRGHVATG